MTKKTTTADRKAKAAREVNAKPDSVATYRMQLGMLRDLGILVDIDVRGFSMFTRAATKAEWGIADADERSPRLKGGQKLLIPVQYIKRLRTLETRFRQVLDKYSSEVSGFKPYRWLPFTAYDKFRAQWTELEADLAMVKRDLLKNYDSFVDSLAEDFAAMARRSWKSIKAQKYDSVTVNGKVFNDQDAFVDYVVNNAIAKMPSKATIEAGIGVDYRTAILANDSDVQAELLAEDEARANREAIRATEREAARNELIRDQEAQAKLAAMQQAELERAREQIAAMGSPFDEVVNISRRRMAESATTMLESIQKNGFVRGKIASQAAGLIEFFDLMSVVGDDNLRNKLVSLKSQMGNIGGSRTATDPERDLDQIKQTLNDIIGLAEQEARNSTLNTRFSNIEF